MDGSGSYKGKAEGSNSSQGLWIASPAKTTLTEAKHISWFESAYDEMAYYQLHQANAKDLRKAVFISTGGNPTVEQMRGVLTVSYTHLVLRQNGSNRFHPNCTIMIKI